MTLSQLEKILQLNYLDIQHLNQALIHRSYLNEIRGQNLKSNERYEFLGDAVLELWSSHRLFTDFPDLAEGDLTNLRALIVRTENLAAVAQKLHLGDYLMLSRGEENNGGRLNISLLADTFEAIIGSLYLDQGYSAVDTFLTRVMAESIKHFSSQQVFKDPKSLFQEVAQAKSGITPHYQTLSESGPDHKKIFEVGVYLADKLIATGIGPSKQAAEESASSTAFQKLKDLV